MNWMRRILHRKHKGCELGPFLISLLGEELLAKYMEAMAKEE